MLEIIPNWHPIFVHFSVALLSVAVILHLASHFVTDTTRAEQCTLVARWNLWLGAGFTLFTVAAGLYAYYTIDHDTPSHAAMTVHRNWALATTAIFLAIVAWEFWLQRKKQGKSWLFTGLLLVAAGLLLSTAWHGGELVYRYGLGVMSLPKVEGAGHAHEHGSGAADGHGDMPMPESARPGVAEDGHAHAHDSIDPRQDSTIDVPSSGHHDAPGAAPHPH